MRESRLRWFGHVKRMNMDAAVRRCKSINLPGCRRVRGRPKRSWQEVIKYDLKFMRLTEDMTQDKSL